MSTLVRFGPDGRVLDLAKLSSDDYALIRSLHGEIRRGQRVLNCLQSTASADAAEMYIRAVNDRYWAVHFAGGAHGEHEIALETDEHRRQKDYWCRAAEDGGYSVAKELSTGGGTVLDVAIDGPRRTGVEVQRSTVHTKLVKARTTKSYRAGWLPVWFLDSDRKPTWYHQVPAVGCNVIPWSSLPPRRAATASGLTVVKPLRCTPGAFQRCPDGNRRPCGRWHPNREPMRGITVDDVAVMVPAERLVPMRDIKKQVYLVSPASLAIYRELTGHSGEYDPATGAPKTRTPPHTEKCVNPVHDRELPANCACGEPIYRLAQLVRARDDLCERCRMQLGLPEPWLPSD